MELFKKNKIFIIAEMANSHEGKLSLAKQITESASNAGAELIKFARDKKLKILVDVFGVKSAKDMLSLDIDGYKIHSADLTNPHLLQFLSNTKKAVLLSTAGSLPNEIDEALKFLL